MTAPRTHDGHAWLLNVNADLASLASEQIRLHRIIVFSCVGNSSRHAKMRQLCCQPTRLDFFRHRRRKTASGRQLTAGRNRGWNRQSASQCEAIPIPPAKCRRSQLRFKKSLRQAKACGRPLTEAERSGFEPEMPVTRHTGLAIRRFRPLSHLSGRRRNGRRRFSAVTSSAGRQVRAVRGLRG